MRAPQLAAAIAMSFAMLGCDASCIAPRFGFHAFEATPVVLDEEVTFEGPEKSITTKEALMVGACISGRAYGAVGPEPHTFFAGTYQAITIISGDFTDCSVVLVPRLQASPAVWAVPTEDLKSVIRSARSIPSLLAQAKSDRHFAQSLPSFKPEIRAPNLGALGVLVRRQPGRFL